MVFSFPFCLCELPWSQEYKCPQTSHMNFESNQSSRIPKYFSLKTNTCLPLWSIPLHLVTYSLLRARKCMLCIVSWFTKPGQISCLKWYQSHLHCMSWSGLAKCKAETWYLLLMLCLKCSVTASRSCSGGWLTLLRFFTLRMKLFISRVEITTNRLG